MPVGFELCKVQFHIRHAYCLSSTSDDLVDHIVTSDDLARDVVFHKHMFLFQFLNTNKHVTK